MAELTQEMEEAKAWLKTRTDIQESINRIKIMLWAGDYGRAQEELDRVYEQYAYQFLDRSLAIKSALTARYRKHKGEIEQRYQQQLAGRMLEHRIQEDLAEITRLHDPVSDALYLLGPIANILEKLKERMPNELQKPLPQHKTSGFFHNATLTGVFRWEVRAYCHHDVSMQPHAALEGIARGMGKPYALRQVRKSDWPLSFRTFSEEAFIEYKFYNATRFVADVVGNEETQIEDLSEAILNAIGCAVIGGDSR